MHERNHIRIELTIFYEKMLRQYIKKILTVARRGDAREESYYPILKELLEGLNDKRKVQVTSQPKKTEAGNPDFRVWDEKQRILGYIEAKPPDRDLDDVEKQSKLNVTKQRFPISY